MKTEPAFHEFPVSDELAGRTLGTVLRAWRSGSTWSQVRRLIANRHVEVNRNLCLDEGRRLQAGEVVTLWREPRAPLPERRDVRIRYRDAHVVVLEKPAGVITLRKEGEQHWSRRRRLLQPTLDELLSEVLAGNFHSRAAKGTGRRPRPPIPRPVHRLDRDTSGLMLFALTTDAQSRLQRMFRDHDMERVYLAVVQGHMEARTFESFLADDRGDGLRGSTTRSDLGKRAVTHVRPMEYLLGHTLVECRLETGRTHQIRIHLAEAGHMVCGEKLYCRRPDGKIAEDTSGAPRQMLHAAEIGFHHPITGEPLHFHMAIPPDMAQVIDRLRPGSRRP